MGAMARLAFTAKNPGCPKENELEGPKGDKGGSVRGILR